MQQLESLQQLEYVRIEPERWNPRLRKVWVGYYHLLPYWKRVAALRQQLISELVHLSARFNAELKFQLFDFNNKPLLPTWQGIEEIDYEMLLFAPVVFRELFPNELLIEIDDTDDSRLLKKALLIKNALDALAIEYTLSFTGRRSFHFSIIIDCKDIDVQQLKQPILKNVIQLGGSFIDLAASGALSKRRMIREFYSLNTRDNAFTFKIPVKLEIKRIRFPDTPKAFTGYKIWKPHDFQIDLLLNRAEENRTKPIQLIKFQRRPGGKKNSKKSGNRKIRPCILKLIDKAQQGVNLEHHERVALVAELYHAGSSKDKILEVFRKQPDFDQEKTLYQIEHITEKGTNAPYKPFKCETIQQFGFCVNCKF